LVKINIEILNLADHDRGAVLGIKAPNGGGIGLTAVDGDRRRDAMAANGLGEKPRGRALVSVRGEQEINGLAGFIHGLVQVTPLPFHLDVVCLVHAPTHPHRPFTTVKRLLKVGTVSEAPAVDRGVVDSDPTFLHHFFKLPVAQGIGHIPPDAR
jgi:hypothetical protein